MNDARRINYLYIVDAIMVTGFLVLDVLCIHQKYYHTETLGMRSLELLQCATYSLLCIPNYILAIINPAIIGSVSGLLKILGIFIVSFAPIAYGFKRMLQAYHTRKFAWYIVLMIYLLLSVGLFNYWILFSTLDAGIDG